MKRLFSLLLLTVACCGAAFAQNHSIDELQRMFDYDQKAALELEEVSTVTR